MDVGTHTLPSSLSFDLFAERKYESSSVPRLATLQSYIRCLKILCFKLIEILIVSIADARHLDLQSTGR